MLHGLPVNCRRTEQYLLHLFNTYVDIVSEFRRLIAARQLRASAVAMPFLLQGLLRA